MDKVYLCIILFLFMSNSFPQVPILFYDFESNANRNNFENSVEQSINSGGGQITRAGSGEISTGYGNLGIGKGLWGYNWQNVIADPGINATEYYQFVVNTCGFKGITIRFRQKAPYSSSPGYVGCNFSSNGTTFKNAGNNITGAPSSNWSDASIPLYNYPEANNNPNVIIRIYAFKGLSTNSSGLLAIDNLVITADTIMAGAGNIDLLNETDFYKSYYSEETGSMPCSWKKSLVINGPGTIVSLNSPVNFLQKFIVNNGGALKCAGFPVWGAGSFTLNSGSAIYIGDPGGIISGTDSVGNICVQGSRIYSSGADYYYNGIAAQVTGNGLPPSVNILGINNSGGVVLSNSVLVLDTLKLQAGNLTLGNNNLIINDTAVIAEASPQSYVVTDNSGEMIYNKMAQRTDIKFPVGTINSYNPAIINYSGISDTFKVKVKGSIDFALTNPEMVVNRQWTISENTPGGSDATIKLEWVKGDQAAGFNINSTIMMGRWDGTNFNQTRAFISGSGTSEDPYVASSQGITAFSCFGLGNEASLPVELCYFGCSLNGRKITLNWKTATEKNSYNFDIERKNLNKDTWEIAGSVRANFMSNSTKQYNFSENDMEPGKYFYRLRMNDNDGSFQYSNILEAEVKVPHLFSLFQNYPNPFNPNTRISFELPEEARILLEVFDVKGTKVSCLINESRKAGFYNVEFKPTDTGINLVSGIYFYRMNVEAASGKRVSIVKKMVYMK